MIALILISKLCFLSVCVGDAAFASVKTGKSLDATSGKDAGAIERPGPHKVPSMSTSKANKLPPKEDDERVSYLCLMVVTF
jgi:hypothetical protein